MAVDNLQVLDIIEVMEAFLERKRPPEHIRPKLDIGYKIEGQSIIIHEIRPFWNDASKIIYPEVAKAIRLNTLLCPDKLSSIIPVIVESPLFRSKLYFLQAHVFQI